MTDLSNLSDNDLIFLHSMGGETASADTASPLSQMSDADLQAAYQQTTPSEGSTLAQSAWDVAKQIPAGLATLGESIPSSTANLFGLAGKGAEYLFGQGDPEAVAQRQQMQSLIAQQRGGGISDYLPEPQTPAGRVTRYMTPFVGGALTMPGNLAGNAAIGALAGAGAGAGGALGGPVGEAVGGLLGAGVGTKAVGAIGALGATRGAPTLEEMGNIVDKGYQAARDAGVKLNPTYISEGLNGIIGNLTTGPAARSPTLIEKTLGILSGGAKETAPNAPGAMSALTGVQPAAKGPVDFNRLDAIRRDLGDLAKSKNPDMATEAAAARIAQNGIDNLLESAAATPGAVLGGDANLLAQTAREARGNAAAEFRLRAMDALREQAQGAGGSLFSGRNIEGAYRSRLNAFTRPNYAGVSPAMERGFSQPEIDAMRAASRGTSIPNMVRLVGNLGAGGGGAIAGYELAHGTTDPTYLALAGLGFGGRSLGNALMRARFNQINRMIGLRSPEGVARGLLPAPVAPGLLGSVPFARPAFGGILRTPGP